MTKNQAQQSLSLVNIAIDTIQKIALQEQELLGTKTRDYRYIRALVLLQDKQRSAEQFTKR